MSRLATSKPRRADLTGLSGADHHAASFTGLPATLGNIWSSMMLYWPSLTVTSGFSRCCWWRNGMWKEQVDRDQCCRIPEDEDRTKLVRFASLRQWASLPCASINPRASLCWSGDVDVCNIWYSNGTKLNRPLHIKKKESSPSLRPIRPVRHTFPSLRLSELGVCEVWVLGRRGKMRTNFQFGEPSTRRPATEHKVTLFSSLPHRAWKSYHRL
jgi:hypothetical protein